MLATPGEWTTLLPGVSPVLYELAALRPVEVGASSFVAGAGPCATVVVDVLFSVVADEVVRGDA